MTVKAAKLGHKISEVPIEYRERIGKSKLNPLTDSLKMLFSLLNIANSETSLLARIIMLPSLIFGLFGMVFGITSFYDFITVGAPRPHYPLVSVLIVLVGVQLFSLGLIIDNLTKKLSRIEEKAAK
ncbi:MAG: hypothetical protein JSV96_01450 [Candidatus Aminicenantes bacterium]|nr:MAG: hypothetical protein JSV96_01450 [Candidatus Aminicenantes bacterium]